MTYRLRNIGIAIVLAVVAALLTTFYVTNYKRSVQHSEGNKERIRHAGFQVLILHRGACTLSANRERSIGLHKFDRRQRMPR